MATLTPHELAVAIEACAFDAVPNDQVSGWPINRHGVVIGEIAWDDCECGQLVVAETRRYPSAAFPLEEVNHTDACNEPWLVVTYTLSLTRCVAIADESGTPPSITSLSASAARNSDDMTKIRHAVMCCLSELYNEHQLDAFELGPQEITGPNGMCAGFDLTIHVGWTNDCGC